MCRELERLTKIAKKFLVKAHHDKQDGELILTGHLKPFETNNASSQQSTVTFCGIRECTEQACFKCNNEEDKCKGVSFCCLHGPEHEQHTAQFYKSQQDMDSMMQQYNEKLLSTAMDRVQEKMHASSKREKKKRKERMERIERLTKVVDESMELTTVATKTKQMNRDSIIIKNKKMLNELAERQASKKSRKQTTRKRSITAIQSDTSLDVILSNSELTIPHPIEENIAFSVHDSSESAIETSISANINYNCSDNTIDPNNDTVDPTNKELTESDIKKTKLSVDNYDAIGYKLQRVVDHLIELANDDGKKHKPINFDIEMENALNIAYYKNHLKHLATMYQISVDATMLSNDNTGSVKEQKSRRTKLIQVICDGLRLTKRVRVEKIESRFK